MGVKLPAASRGELHFFHSMKKVTGFFKDAVDDGRISKVGETEEGMTFYRPTGKGMKK
jgi:hypothetical protein